MAVQRSNLLYSSIDNNSERQSIDKECISNFFPDNLSVMHKNTGTHIAGNIKFDSSSFDDDDHFRETNRHALGGLGIDLEVDLAFIG